MFPISDDNPRIRTPMVTWSIIGVCVLVFLWQVSLGEEQGQVAVFQFGMIPARLFGEAQLRSEFAAMPAWSTVLTSMFMHGGWLHLGLNMLFLWIFGDNVEDSMGHVRYLVFYLACGIAAAMTQALMNPDSTIPTVGASGAISGVLGAYVSFAPPRHRARADLHRRVRHHRAYAGADRARSLVLDAVCQRGLFADRGPWRCFLGACRRIRFRHGVCAVVKAKGRVAISGGPLAPL